MAKMKNKEPTRRSSRTKKEESSPAVHDHPRAAKSITPPVKSTRGKKRRNEVAVEVQQTVVSPKIQKTIEGRAIDGFCWICHKAGQELICKSCPRVYHEDCLFKSHLIFNSSGCCAECQAQSLIKGLPPSQISRQRLREVLKLAMQEALKEEVKRNSPKVPPKSVENIKFCKYFKTWSQEADNENLCQIIDLDILIDKMNDDSPYLTCAEFFSDVKWIYHNCYILHGPDSEITEYAMKLEKNFKQELLDIEGCHECYFITHSDDYMHADFFTRVCEDTHDIIWAKLRGSPYWPAKCLKIYNGHADVRFFGTHDKSVIPVSHCFRISQRSPNDKEIRQSKYQDAITELSIYISNYRSLHGSFVYYPVRTPLQLKGLKKMNKKGRHRRSNSDNKFLNESYFSEHDVEVDESFKLFYGVLKTKLEDPLGYNISFDNSDSPSNEQHLNMSNVLRSNNYVNMEFSTEESDQPNDKNQNMYSEYMDASTPVSTSHGFSETHLACSPNEEGSDFVQDADPLMNTGGGETLTQSNTLPFVNSNVSSTLPVITSAVSQDIKNLDSFPDQGPADFSAENGLQSNNSYLQKLADLIKSQPSLSALVNSNLTESSNEFAATDDEVMVIGEKNLEVNTVNDIMKNSKLVYGLCQVISSNRPQLQDLLKQCLDFGLNTYLRVWLTASIRKSDDTAAKAFVALCTKLVEEKSVLVSENEVLRKENQSFRLHTEQMKGELKAANNRVKVACSRQDNARKIIGVLSAKASNKNQALLEQQKNEEGTLEEDLADLAIKVQELKDRHDEKDERHKLDQEKISDLLNQLESSKVSVTSVEVQTVLTDKPDNEMFTLHDMQELNCGDIPDEDNSSESQGTLESDDEISDDYVETGQKITVTKTTQRQAVVAHLDEPLAYSLLNQSGGALPMDGSSVLTQEYSVPSAVFIGNNPSPIILPSAGASLTTRNTIRLMSKSRNRIRFQPNNK